jgi:hypothetical protein
MSADALFGRPVVCKPMKFGKNSDREKPFVIIQQEAYFKTTTTTCLNSE